MAVLVEAISVIVRRDAIDSKYLGGWDAFEENTPNRTLCMDEHLARIGFMSPTDVESFIKYLESYGLVYLDNEAAQDIAVADQQSGLTAECDWLEFGKLGFGSAGKVSACWFFDGPRIAAGTHLSSLSMQLATPVGWEFEGSLSHTFGYTPTEHFEKILKFLRHEDGLDIYLNTLTGEEERVGRPLIDKPSQYKH
jgi:hypothetical protein